MWVRFETRDISSYGLLIANVIALEQPLAECRGVGFNASCLRALLEPIPCPLIKISRMEGLTLFIRELFPGYGAWVDSSAPEPCGGMAGKVHNRSRST